MSISRSANPYGAHLRRTEKFTFHSASSSERAPRRRKGKIKAKTVAIVAPTWGEDEVEVEVSSSSRQTATKCDRFEPKENKAWLNDIRCQPQARGLPAPLLPQRIFCAFFCEWMPDAAEEVVMIIVMTAIHSWSSPWFCLFFRIFVSFCSFLVPVWCLCVAVISPRNKKNVCKPGLILFIGLLGPLYCVLAVAALKFCFLTVFGVCCQDLVDVVAFPAWQSVTQSARLWILCCRSLRLRWSPAPKAVN